MDNRYKTKVLYKQKFMKKKNMEYDTFSMSYRPWLFEILELVEHQQPFLRTLHQKQLVSWSQIRLHMPEIEATSKVQF